jgi:phage shock protein E
MSHRLLLILSLLVLGSTLASCQVATGDKLTADQMKAIIDSKQPVFLLDVRTPTELRENGMLEGAVNIPINELEARINEVPKDKKVISICARGNRAKKAADLLGAKGYTPPPVFGMADWTAKGYPVVHPK